MSGTAFAHQAFIALGANLPSNAGDPVQTLRLAVAALQSLSTVPVQVSPFFESAPQECPPGSPRYVNAVAMLLPLSDETPLSLLYKLQGIELDFGRTRSGIRNESRSLDLDLLTFAEATSATAELTLPHPRAHERRFVLEPWVALAGAEFLLHGQPLSYWLSECNDLPLARLPS
jgi:2-amino-4-hydroxy-6-hydroxymethyldihydropteridine diphosphokinase